MAFSKMFERRLNELFRQRTHWLRQRLGTKVAGKPPGFDRRKVDAGIRDLQRIASDAMAHRMAKTEFDDHVDLRRNFHVRGRGIDEKKTQFEQWFGTHFKGTEGFVYAFWGTQRKCIYVGRTGSGGNRPSSHFDKYWFSGAKRITLFSVKKKSHLAKLECLAIHRFQPTQNRNKAAARKWNKACPLCTAHRDIEAELRAIFRLK